MPCTCLKLVHLQSHQEPDPYQIYKRKLKFTEFKLQIRYISFKIKNMKFGLVYMAQLTLKRYEVP